MILYWVTKIERHIFPKNEESYVINEKALYRFTQASILFFESHGP